MIRLTVKKPEDQELLPHYASPLSAAADLKSAVDITIEPMMQVKVPTGVFIDQIDTTKVPDGMIAALQIRARSGLALKHGITLTNGVGTIDGDYTHEICVLMWNTSAKSPLVIKRGDRIAQICGELLPRLDLDISSQQRMGGFGSTGFGA